MIKNLLSNWKSCFSIFFQTALLILVIGNATIIKAQDGNSGLVGKWDLISASVINPASKEPLDPLTFLFRDAVKQKTPITFKDNGVFLFQKDNISQNWKFRIKEKGIIHLIEYEKIDNKGEKSSAYIDYNFELIGNQLKLFRKDNASQELYIFSLTK